MQSSFPFGPKQPLARRRWGFLHPPLYPPSPTSRRCCRGITVYSERDALTRRRFHTCDPLPLFSSSSSPKFSEQPWPSLPHPLLVSYPIFTGEATEIAAASSRHLLLAHKSPDARGHLAGVSRLRDNAFALVLACTGIRSLSWRENSAVSRRCLSRYSRLKHVVPRRSEIFRVAICLPRDGSLGAERSA